MWASDCQVYSDYLHLEHRQIHEVVTGIEREIHGGLTNDRESKVTPDLEHLRALLMRHFEQEEDGGCLEQAACCCPRLSRAVSQIATEHRSLLAQLDGLIDKVQNGFPKGNRSDFSRLLADFTRHLDAHDTAENQVLEEAFGSNRD